MNSMAGGIYDYLDESTRFCRESTRLKTLTSHSYNCHEGTPYKSS